MDEEAHRKHVPLQVFIDHLRALLEVVSNTICKSDSAYNRLEALLTSSEVMPSMPWIRENYIVLN